jgi:hypothetical protein
MPSDVSLVDVRKSFQAVAGLESMTEMDNFFFQQSLNRAVQRAYDQSPSWPRYLVVSEERDINAYVLSGASASTSTSVNQNYKLVGSIDSSGANILNITSSVDGKAYITYKKNYSSSFTETSTDVPAEFFDYILYTVLSSFYTGDGQTEKAMIAEETATKMLDRELFKLDTLSNRNTITKRFSTYVNHQSR